MTRLFQDVTSFDGDLSSLSKKSLYKILSENRDSKPRFETIVKLLDALGLRLTVEEKPQAS